MYLPNASARDPFMSSEFEDKPYSDSNLDSPEYRKRLMRKLNTLIAVLEVACAKVKRSLAGPDPEIERLLRIQKNLKETLQVCVRAKRALERCEELPADLPANLKRVAGEHGLSLPEGAQFVPDRRGLAVEISDEEQKKFERLGPIHPKEIRACDLDDLCQQLLEGKSD